MTEGLIIIFGCSLITTVICITCYVVISANKQLKKYSITPIDPDEYPA